MRPGFSVSPDSFRTESEDPIPVDVSIQRDYCAKRKNQQDILPREPEEHLLVPPVFLAHFFFLPGWKQPV